MPLHQDITFFADDDLTPLLGTVDGGGNITQSSFSTDPAHVRPYLDFVKEAGESEVIFHEGKSVIGAVNFIVLDKRLVATDQATGIVTDKLSGSGGDTQVLMRRCVLRQQRADLTWEVIMDGVLASFELDESLVAYRGSMRDIREREQKTRCFVRADTTCVWPYGLVTGWKGQKRRNRLGAEVTTYLVPPVAPLRATFRRDSSGSVLVGRAQMTFPGDFSHHLWKAVFANGDAIERARKYGWPSPTYSDVDASFQGIKYSGVAVDWRPYGSAPGTAYTRLWPMPFRDTARDDVSNVFVLRNIPTPAANVIGVKQVIQWVVLSTVVGNGSDLPADGADIELRVVSMSEPTDEVPLFLEESSAGELLKQLYDGTKYTLTNAKVRYETVAMNAFIANTPPVYGIITEAEKDMRAFTEKEIFKPFGWAPSINGVGQVRPIPYAMPDATVPLLVLDNNNVSVEGTDWRHGVNRAVTRVEFDYVRDYMGERRDDEGDWLPNLDRRMERPVHHFKRGKYSTFFGDKPLTYSPKLLRATGAEGGVPIGDAMDEGPARVALRRINEALDRFGQGAQEIIVRAARSHAGVRAAREGDWCQIGLSWMPDYITRRRGINRIGQIVKVKNLDPSWREFTIVDAGPYGQPIAQVTAQNGLVTADFCLQADIASPLPTNPDGVQSDFELQYAFGTAQPATDSGAWLLLARGPTPGTFKSPPLPAGVSAWLRWRGVKEGRRPSVWAGFGPYAIPLYPSLIDLRLRVDQNGFPVVDATFSQSAAGGGVRIIWTIYADGAAMPAEGTWTTTDAAVDANGRAIVTLPTALRQRQNIAVRVQPYTAFPIGGTAGLQSRVYESQRIDLPAIMPDPRVRGSEPAGQNSGKLDLELIDPQLRVTLVEMRTAAGNADFGAWLPITPIAGVYTGSVSLVDKQVSKIQWRATGVKADQTTGILLESTERFTPGARPARPEIRYYVDANDRLNWIVRGDFDSTSTRGMAKLDSEPTKSEIDATALVAGRIGTYQYATQLRAGQRFFVGGRAYNSALGGSTDNQGSEDIETQNDVWTGSSLASSTVSATATTTDQAVNLSSINYGRQALYVEIYAEEHTTDPGAARDVSGSGILVATLKEGTSSHSVIGSRPSNYFLLTLVPIDGVNRKGTPLNIKAQLQAAPPPAALPPNDLQLVQTGQPLGSVRLDITNPNDAANPDAYRLFRDGAAYGADITRTGGALAVMQVVVSGQTAGQTYQWQVFGVRLGVLSTTGSPVRTVLMNAGALPAPTALSVSNAGLHQASVNPTPHVDTPAGVTYVLEHAAASGGPWFAVESSNSEPFTHTHFASSPSTDWFRVKVRKDGWSDSGYSPLASIPLPFS
jgi:hypothetical protein